MITRPCKTKTILVVEDDEDVRKTVMMALELCGFRVLCAQNAIEARLLSAKHRDEIELLLTDVVMPDINGRVLAEELIGLNPSWKLLFMSGYTDGNFDLRDDKHNHFIQKPFTIKQMTEKLTALLQENEEEREE